MGIEFNDFGDGCKEVNQKYMLVMQSDGSYDLILRADCALSSQMQDQPINVEAKSYSENQLVDNGLIGEVIHTES